MVAAATVPLVLQVAVPIALLTRLAFGRERTRGAAVLHTVAVGAYLLVTALAGLWLIIPSGFLQLCAVLFLVLAARLAWRVRLLPWRPTDWEDWRAVVIHGVAAAVAMALALTALAGRRPPAQDAVNLTFPLAGGTYYVAGGGSSELLNPHLMTLSEERFRDYRGQSYGVDIVKIGAFGTRASGVLPRAPERYFIFGDVVYAPCDGTVLRAADGFPDMSPPETDRAHMPGNHVFLECGAVHVLLGHFRKGSVRVRPGDGVAIGDALGEVGNSGNSDEPHLHVHAQRPAPDASFLSGDPLPIRFDGRFLSRNDRVSIGSANSSGNARKISSILGHPPVSYVR